MVTTIIGSKSRHLQTMRTHKGISMGNEFWTPEEVHVAYKRVTAKSYNISREDILKVYKNLDTKGVERDTL